MKNKYLIYTGFIIPIVFWSTITICGLMTDNYNHLVNLVSELGAIGTKTQHIFTVGLVLSSLLSMLFIIGLYKTARKIGLKTFPILIIITFSFSIFGAAIFPLPLRLHGILGSPSMFLPLSPLFALIFWKTQTIRDIKVISTLVFLVMILGFLTLAPNILNDYFGLKQRFFHIGWTFWFIYLSQRFIELDKINA